MRRLLDLGGAGRLLLLMPALAALLLVGARPASAATLSVCQSGCPFTQLAPALAAAHGGDTIKIAPGTLRRRRHDRRSVTLVGAGPGATIIRGGGPVLTIGVPFAASEPTVTIDGITVTGGVTIGNRHAVQRPRRRHLHSPRGRAVHRRHRHDPRQCHQRQQCRPERGDRLR